VSDALKFHMAMPTADLARLERQQVTDPVEAAKKFEGLMIQMMVKEMRKTLPENGLFGSDEISMYEDLFDQVIADRIAEGRGLGLAEQIIQSPSERFLGAGDAPAAADLRPGSPRISLPSVDPGRRAPMPVFGRITSLFGQRRDPIHGQERHHNGMDIAAPEGSPIQSIRPGVVTFAGDMGTYGKVVVVDHGEGLETRYAHCSELLVEEGEKVRPGNVIAKVGSTGRSTGPHLHFEARKGDQPLDPRTLFGWQGEKELK
jgi:murein DD-endopeptidase MepM/ murein hydrolase activator NlpD